MTNGRQQITDRNQSPKLVRQNNFSFPHPDFISENAIIYPLIHFQMPSTYFLVVLTMEQENLRPFDLCVLECLAVPSQFWPFLWFRWKNNQEALLRRPPFHGHSFCQKKKTQLEVNVNIPFEYLSNFERSLHFNKEVHVLI